MYKVTLLFTRSVDLVDGHGDTYSFKEGDEVQAQIHSTGIIIRLPVEGKDRWSTLFKLTFLSQYTFITEGEKV